MLRGDEVLRGAQQTMSNREVSRAAAAAVRLAAAGAASAAVASTGGAASPLVPLAVAIAAVCGVNAGIVAGAIAGVVVAAGSLPALAAEAGAGVPVNHLAAWMMLFPLSGTVGGLVQRLRSRPDPAIERRRIARDLHDGVAQTLAHLRLELDMLSHPDLARASDPESLARLASVANRTLTDVRALINDLSAPLPDGGLAKALRDHIADMQTGRGPLITFESAGRLPAPPAVESQMYRIAQEALSNAVRHSNAAIVRVSLDGDAEGVRLTIEDDGDGIAGERDGGIGLQTMRERALAVGADFSIETGPQGTRVTVAHARSLTRSA